MKRARTELTVALSDSWNVSYNLTERDSSNDHRNVQMSWQNRTVDQVAENLNAFLVAAGMPLKVLPIE